jgi:hypothetical protein
MRWKYIPSYSYLRLESVFGTTEIPEIIFACGPPDDVTAVEKKYPETFSKLTVR